MRIGAEHLCERHKDGDVAVWIGTAGLWSLKHVVPRRLQGGQDPEHPVDRPPFALRGLIASWLRIALKMGIVRRLPPTVIVTGWKKTSWRTVETDFDPFGRPFGLPD